MRYQVLGLIALGMSVGLVGCGEEPKAGGNADAAAVIGAAPDSTNYGAASSDLMNKMHGDSLKKAAGKTAAPATTPAPADNKAAAPAPK